MIEIQEYGCPAQLIRPGRVIGMAGEPTRFPVHRMQTISRRPDPEISITVFEDSPDLIID